jgi:hypothetical protein
MAANDLPTKQVPNTVNSLYSNVQGISDLIKLFTGSEQTVNESSSSKSTTKLDITKEGVDQLIRQILEGNQGLASVAGGQKAPGLYNSSTQQLLLNDLISRAAGEVAARSAPTTTSTQNNGTRQVVTPPAISPMKALLGTAGAVAAKKIFAKSGLEKKVDDIFGNIFGSGSDAGSFAESVGGSFVEDPYTAAFGTGATGDIFNYGSVFGTGTDYVGDFTSGLTNPLSDFGSFSSSIGSSLFDSVGGSALSDLFSNSVFDSADAYALNFGLDAFGEQAAQLAAQTADFGIDAAADSFDFGFDTGGFPIFSVGKNLIEGDVTGAAFTAAGYAIGGPVGGFLGGLLGDFFGSDCFLTTIVCEQLGLPDNCEALETLRHFRDTWLKENHPDEIDKYYETAPAIVEKLRAMELNKDFYSALYEDYIMRTVEYVKADKFPEAFETYKLLVDFVSSFVEE